MTFFQIFQHIKIFCLDSERLNRLIIDSSKDDIEQNKEQNDNEELITLMKHLVHISGDTDLKMIIDNVLKINSNKESLFRHLMFLEQQVSQVFMISCILENYVSLKTELLWLIFLYYLGIINNSKLIIVPTT